MSSERKPPDDGELEDFLAGRHPLGRAYREVSEHQTAPRELDDAILRMAREQAAVPVRRRPRWLQPLAVAATLALSLGVLMNIWREPALREQAVPAVKEAVTVPSPAPAPIPEPVEEKLKFEAPPSMPEVNAYKKFAPPPEPPKPEPESRRAAQPFPRDAEPKPVQREQDASSLSDSVSPSATSPRADTSVAPTTPPPPPPAPGAAGPASPAASGAAQSRPDVDPRRAEPERDADDAFSRDQPETHMEMQAPSAAPAMREQESRARAKEQATVQKSMADDGATMKRSEDVSPPSRDALIQRARAALERGDVEEARRRIAELRRLYPDATLPEDLRAVAPPAP